MNATATPSPPRTQSQPEPPIRGETLLRLLEAPFLKLEQLSSKLLPDPINPLLHTGAVVNVLLIIAIATGGLLLIWYSPSVHSAYGSMKAIEAGLLPSLVRTLHRYSSDGCVFFGLWHAVRLTAARRFTGARWLAWITGLAAIALLWLTGWLGYWLVWDEPARQIAIGTSRFLDRLPVFGDPLEGAFLTDAAVNSLLFFIIFFVHMLIPLAMGIALWLHLARLQRPVFLTKTKLTVAVCLSLAVLSLVAPAAVAGPAKMDIFPTKFAIDAWYLAPLWLTDRLGGGVLWALLSVGTLLLFVAPWAAKKAKKTSLPAVIITERCNACEHCVEDCPYEAISLVPRTDGRPFKLQALVDPSRCVGCGICAGSCASAGSTLPHFDTLEQRAKAEAWLKEAAGGPVPMIAYLCHDAVPAWLQVDEKTGLCESLPGYRVMQTPCAGWVHAITVERLLREGSPGVLIAGCAGSCRFREGLTWATGRVAGSHSTPLSPRVDPKKVHIIELNRLELSRLTAEAASFRKERIEGAPLARPGGKRQAVLGAGVLSVASAALLWGGNQLVYVPPQPIAPRLAVSFKHPGVVAEKCRALSEEEKAKQPAHMRRETECVRGRQPVRLKLLVDGQLALERKYAAAGLWGDGSSVALEEFNVPEGKHVVSVALGDTADESEWTYQDQQTLELSVGHRYTILFDRTAGFSWH